MKNKILIVSPKQNKTEQKRYVSGSDQSVTY